MTVTIGELMRGTTGAEFRSDVQIAHYRTPHNLDLLKHYIFTSIAPSQKKSSVELLHIFSRAFTPGALENRFVVIATYGHGKSHFALALANFFGKPAGSDESKAVLEAIRRAVPDNDLATYGDLEAFRRQHSPYLVLILRGDEPSDLPTKFNRAIKEALADDESRDSNTPLPFWFASAETFLTSIPETLQKQANAYLAQYNLDLESLLGNVRDGQASTYDICVGLSQELFRVRPQFEVDLSLKDAVQWLVDNKCGPGKPYAGVLILFDEFSAFVDSYCHSQIPGTPLQDLLNGVADNRERAAFIAFAQHDPNEVARRSAHGETLSNVLKEIGRLPTSRRFQLHSSLEEVLESYLRKNGDLWIDLLGDESPFGKALDEATSRALHGFRKRYLDDLKWGSEHFHQVVTVGCFPMHPLTTSILCSIELQTTPSPRSVLGFVHGELDRKGREPAELGDTPNWIRATALVDYFREMLSTEDWQRYQDALSALSVPDEPNEATVLKAMLLQAAGNVSTSSLGYTKTIAELTGLWLGDATQILVTLAARGIIRKDSVTGAYSLPPSGWGRGGEKLILEKMQRITLDGSTLESVRTELRQLGLDPTYLVVPWGHRENWFFDHLLIERDRATKEYLHGIRRRIVWGLDADGSEKARGLVIWTIAMSEYDVEWYRDHLPELLRDAFGDTPIPLVVMRPKAPSTALIERLKRYLALKDFTTHERSQVGQDWYRTMREQAETDLRAAVRSFKADCTAEAPVAFRAQLNRSVARNMDGLLTEIVQMAYPYGPKRWFTQYKLTTGRLPNAVSSVCAWLLRGDKLDASLFVGRSLEKDVIELYIRGSWHLLDTSLRTIPPTVGSEVYRAWMALEQHFEAGTPSRTARPILEKLLNPPFGYDWNTLALLFAAWWSHYRYDLAVDGTPYLPVSGTIPRPRELLQRIGGCLIRRTSSTEVRSEIEKLIEDVKSGRRRSLSEAHGEVRKLEDFVAREGEDAALQEKVQHALGRLREGLEQANEYGEQTRRILQRAERTSIPDLLDCLSLVRKLPTVQLVISEQPPTYEISDRVRQRLGEAVGRYCLQFGSLQRPEDFTHNLNQLQLIARHLERHNVTDEIPRITDAIEKLKQAKAELDHKARRDAERREQEAEIRNLSARGPLSELRRGLAKLDTIDPHPEIKPLWEQKRRAIVKELDDLETFAGSLGEQLDRVTVRQGVQELRDRVLREQARCDEGDAHRLVEAALSRSEALHRFFAELDEVKRRTPHSLDDYAGDMERIQKLIADRKEHLAEAQQAVAEKVLAALRESLAEQQRRVFQRFERHRQDLERGVPAEKVQRELERASSDWVFLPKEARSDLEKLQQDVQDRIEQASREREKRLRREAERKELAANIQSLPMRGPVTVLRQSLLRLDELDPPAELKQQWQQKQSAIRQELQRLEHLAQGLRQRLNQAADRRAVDACRTEALQAQALCDEEEMRQAIEQSLLRCQALVEYFEQIDKLRHCPRACPDDFARDVAEIHTLVSATSEYLSDAQSSVAERATVDLETELATKRRTAVECLEQLKKDLERGQPASKIQHDLERADWTFLSADALQRLDEVRHRVQTLIDGDEILQVEMHFRRIRDPQQRRKCLESLQRLIEEVA